MTTFAVICLMMLAVVNVCVRSDFKQDILDRHNHWRAEAGASNMYELTWHDGIAEDAKRSAETCSGNHTKYESRQNRYGFTVLGENLANGEANTIKIVDDWHKEKTNYDEKRCSESTPCGHYTQVVWAESFKLGCGQADCSGRRITICMYGPAGNVEVNNVMLPPFIQGNACTKCTNENNACTHGDKLCVGPPKCADTEKKATCDLWVKNNCKTWTTYRSFFMRICKKTCDLCVNVEEEGKDEKISALQRYNKDH